MSAAVGFLQSADRINLV